jgi:hypothetical protein
MRENRSFATHFCVLGARNRLGTIDATWNSSTESESDLGRNINVMNTISPKYRFRGFTVWDLLIVLVTVVLVLFLWPMFAVHGQRAGHTRIRCVNNLKQIGLALRMWSNDHGEKFPMAISTEKGGSLEAIGTGEVFRHYLTVSNELNSPKVLACSNDQDRRPTSSFLTLSNRNLSYFIGLDAVETDPRLILSGDRNISTNGRMAAGILTLRSNSPVRWTLDLHKGKGNVGLADGTVQQVNDWSLKQQVSSSTNLGLRLELP